MRVASGRVIDGRVELMDVELPEGAAVTVLLSEGDETFEADEATERMLLESIAQCERGETVTFETVLGLTPRKRAADLAREPAARQPAGG
jgi:hypothetical protein